MGFVPPLPPPRRVTKSVAVGVLGLSPGLVGGILRRVLDEARRAQEQELIEKLRRVRCEYCGVRVLAHKGTCSQCGAALPDAERQHLMELAERLDNRRPPEIRPDPVTMMQVWR
jgi:DNA-directed RNA polymerase subunit RPC12/RpoP